MSNTRSHVAHKHFRLNAGKIRRVQRLLGAGTETETIERALDEVIAERRRSRLAREANERFIKSGIPIEDAYGKLAE